MKYLLVLAFLTLIACNNSPFYETVDMNGAKYYLPKDTIKKVRPVHVLVMEVTNSRDSVYLIYPR